MENLRLSLIGSLDGAGNGLANRIIGNEGDNVLIGNGGNDMLSGLGGEDALHGGTGDDRLLGGTENDVLNGGAGKDVLSGGDGDDAFVFDTALDAATNLDRITDFVIGDDAIWLDDAVFTSLTSDLSGQLSAGQFHIGTTATSSSDHLIYDLDRGRLYYDADGLGGDAQILFASLTSNLALTESSFLIV